MTARIAVIDPGAIVGTATAALPETGRREVVICANHAFDGVTLTRAGTDSARRVAVSRP